MGFEVGLRSRKIYRQVNRHSPRRALPNPTAMYKLQRGFVVTFVPEHQQVVRDVLGLSPQGELRTGLITEIGPGGHRWTQRMAHRQAGAPGEEAA